MRVSRQLIGRTELFDPSGFFVSFVDESFGSIKKRATLPDLAGREAALFQILLVIILGAVELAGGNDLGHDGPAIAPGGLELRFGRFGGGLLLRRVVED